MGRRKKISDRLRARVIARDGNVCQLCFRPILPPHKITMDHIIAIKDGGWNGIDNLRVACAQCNHDRHRAPKGFKDHLPPYVPPHIARLKAANVSRPKPRGPSRLRERRVMHEITNTNAAFWLQKFRRRKPPVDDRLAAQKQDEADKERIEETTPPSENTKKGP